MKNHIFNRVPPFYKMKLITHLLILITCLVIQLYSQDESSPINLAVYYPISLNKSTNTNTYLNLSLLYGNVGYVRGLDFSVIASRVNQQMYGLQITGLYTKNLHNFGGVGLTVGLNSIEGIGKGLQLSGLLNHVGKDFEYVQLAGFGNFTGNRFHGLQVSSLFNVVDDEIKGIQIASINKSMHANGAQIGFLNITEENTGLQLGIINISKRQDGVPFGLINLDEKKKVQLISFWSIFSQINTGIRFISNQFFSELYVGRINIESDVEKKTVFAFHYGYFFQAKNYLVGTDFGFLHIDFNPLLKTEKPYYNYPAFQLRLSLDLTITKWLTIFGGVGSTLTLNRYSTDASGRLGELHFIGISLF